MLGSWDKPGRYLGNTSSNSLTTRTKSTEWTYILKTLT